MSAKRALNDKLQGSVAAYLMCGGVVNDRIKKRLFYYWVCEWKKIKSVNSWQSYQQERDCLVHFLRLSAVCWPGAQSAWDNHALAGNFAKYSLIKKISLTQLAINLLRLLLFSLLSANVGLINSNQ